MKMAVFDTLNAIPEFPVQSGKKRKKKKETLIPCFLGHMLTVLYLGLEKKRKFLTKKTKLKLEKNEKKRKFVRGKARFVGPTYSALSLRSSFHKKAPVNRE